MFTSGRFLMFALIGAAAIALLASLAVPVLDSSLIDSRTGERVASVRTDPVGELRRTGDVNAAAARLLRLRSDAFDDRAAIDATFAAELTEPGAPPPPAHPARAAIERERERAASMRRILGTMLGMRLTPERLRMVLQTLEADAAIAQTTERFFAAAQDDAEWLAMISGGPDGLAAVTLSRLRAGASRNFPAPMISVARRYQQAGRGRARRRWLLRGLATRPDAPCIYDELSRAYLEEHRTEEAFLVIGAALERWPDSEPRWRQRAQVAAWLGRPADEAAALAQVVAIKDGVEERKRLVEVLRWSGRPREAVAHAERLAEMVPERAVRDLAAELALEAGDVDEAVRLLERWIQSGDDEPYWRQRLVRIELQDLRVDRAIADLEELDRRFPDPAYQRKLEDLYRVTDRAAPLADLLERRWQRDPSSLPLALEIVALRVQLGEAERVRAVMARTLETNHSPRLFFELLPQYRLAQVPGHAAVALAMASSPLLQGKDFEFAVTQARSYLEPDDFRHVAARLSERFPGSLFAWHLKNEIESEDTTPAALARAAERLAHMNPREPLAIKAWIERAAWASLIDSEARAREAWTERNPDDLDNHQRLALLYEQPSLHDAAAAARHWTPVAAHDGPLSAATQHLVDALIESGSIEAAIRQLEARANDPSASPAERLAVAEQLFQNQLLDQALVYYRAVLADDEAQPLALLRAGQIHSWTDDPRGAIPYLERRLEVTQDQHDLVRFHLGEAYFSIRDVASGRGHHEAALAGMRDVFPRTPQADTMIAKMLVRLERPREAMPIYEQLIAQSPRDVDLHLDYADAMIAMPDLGKARALIEHVLALAPDDARVLRLHGELLVAERRFGDAVPVLARAIAVRGPDAGLLAELGYAQENVGELAAAHSSYRRALALQADSRDIAQSLQPVADRLATLVEVELAHRAVGHDRVLEMDVAGSALVLDDRTRLSAEAGVADYRGRAAAVDGGRTDVDERTGIVNLTGCERIDRADCIGAGIEAYPGVARGARVGAWASLHLEGADPYRSLTVRLHANELLTDPAAAPGLGGRSDGVRAEAYQDFADRWFIAGQLAYESLSLDAAGTGEESDGRASGSVDVGYRLLRGQAAIGEPMSVVRCPHVLPGPFLQREPLLAENPALTVWASYRSIRLLDDKDLATLIPIGERFDYVSGTLRLDVHVARGLGFKAEGFLGAELHETEPFFGLDLGLTWRAADALQLSIGGGVGSAIGRAGADEIATHADAALTWRF